MLVRLTLILACLCLPGSIHAASQQELTEQLEPVVQQIRLANYETAARMMRPFIRSDPREPVYEELLGQIYLLSNRAKMAITHLQRAETMLQQGKAPESRMAYLRLALAIAHYIDGSFATSEAYLHQIINNPHAIPPSLLSDTLNKLAEEHESARDYKAALAIYAISATQFNSTTAQHKIREMRKRLRTGDGNGENGGESPHDRTPAGPVKQLPPATTRGGQPRQDTAPQQ